MKAVTFTQLKSGLLTDCNKKKMLWKMKKKYDSICKKNKMGSRRKINGHIDNKSTTSPAQADGSGEC